MAVFTVGARNGRSSPSGGCFERSSVVPAGRPDVSGWKRTSNRLRVFSQRSTAASHVADRELPVSRQVGVELPGVAEVGVVLVQQVGLAAESADALEAGDEGELLLRPSPIELGLGRAGLGQQRNLLGDDLLDLASDASGRAVACTTTPPAISAPRGTR